MCPRFRRQKRCDWTENVSFLDSLALFMGCFVEHFTSDATTRFILLINITYSPAPSQNITGCAAQTVSVKHGSPGPGGAGTGL